MTHYYKYCIHCGVRYTHQGSGHGCGRQENDREYCPECMTTISLALETIPVKVKNKFIHTDDISPDEFFAAIKKREEEREEGSLIFERIFPGLVNLNSGDTQNSRSITIKKTLYYMTWWTSKKDYEIKKEVKWDIVNDCEYKK